MKKQYIEDRLNGIKGSSRTGRIGEKENINIKKEEVKKIHAYDLYIISTVQCRGRVLLTCQFSSRWYL